METDVLGVLERLQEVADEIDRLEARRREAQEAKDRAEAALEKARGVLAAEEERHHGMDMERRKRELVIKDEKDRMARVKSRMGEVKTSREYQAILAEMGSAQQTVAEQETVLTQEREDLETLEAEIAVSKAELAETEGVRAEADARLQGVVAETQAAVADSRARETDLLSGLPREVVDRYRLIRTRRGGLAVVEAREEACTACHMHIPAQTYIEVIRRSRVIQCPNCHRILVPPREALPA